MRERAKFILEGEGRFEVREYMGQASLVAQKLNCLPPIRETWVQYLGREDPLEKEMASHASMLAWKISWTVEPVGPWGR